MGPIAAGPSLVCVDVNDVACLEALPWDERGSQAQSEQLVRPQAGDAEKGQHETIAEEPGALGPPNNIDRGWLDFGPE